MFSGFLKKRNPRCRYPFSLDQQRTLVLRRPAPFLRFRVFQDPLPGFVPPLASLYALRRRAVPMQSCVRSNSGSGLAANRRNRITPRAPILPLTEFSVFLNQRSTKDPHPPSSHSPVGVAGDFWLGSRFRSPTGSTKNCQRTRLFLLLSLFPSTEFCRLVSSLDFSHIAGIAHRPARFLCSRLGDDPQKMRQSRIHAVSTAPQPGAGRAFGRISIVTNRAETAPDATFAFRGRCVRRTKPRWAQGCASSADFWRTL